MSKIWEPDNYKNNPYGYLTNQISHVYLGFCLVSYYCWFMFHVIGRFPDPVIAAVVVTVAYLIFWEYVTQGWSGWDSIEDTLYTCVGASSFILIDMSEVIDRLVILLTGLAIPMAIGYVRRL